LLAQTVAEPHLPWPYAVGELVAEFERHVRESADPQRAVAEKAYLKSDLDFVGAGVPAVRAAVKTLIGGLDDVDHDTVCALAEKLWRSREHERRLAASFVLVRGSLLLSVNDAPLLERLIRESRTWALVDVLAGDCVGVIARDDERFGSVLDRWATDADFWVRRSALLALLPSIRLHRTEPRHPEVGQCLVRYADMMVTDPEFFIRKAIGWALREAGKYDPDLVCNWLLRQPLPVSAVTWREAVKYLPDEQRAIVEARRADYRGAP